LDPQDGGKEALSPTCFTFLLLKGFFTQAHEDDFLRTDDEVAALSAEVKCLGSFPLDRDEEEDWSVVVTVVVALLDEYARATPVLFGEGSARGTSGRW